MTLHGRAGKRGRPEKTANPFLELRIGAKSKPMKLLMAAAARRPDLTIGALASGADPKKSRDPTALVRSILADRPQQQSIELIVDALRFSESVARALTDQLTDDDLRSLKNLALGEVVRRRAFFQDSALATIALRRALESLPRKKSYTALRRYCLALHGLVDLPADDDLGYPAADPDLGRALGELNAELDPEFDLRELLIDHDSIRKRRIEVHAAFLWLRVAAGLSDEDEGKIGRTLADYLGNTDLDLSKPDAYMNESAALDAAIKAFRSKLHAYDRGIQ